jgi:hypothetical protein
MSDVLTAFQQYGGRSERFDPRVAEQPGQSSALGLRRTSRQPWRKGPAGC